MVEHPAVNRRDVGSNPTCGAQLMKHIGGEARERDLLGFFVYRGVAFKKN